MKIIKNDSVLIISGKDRGRKGKVIETLPKAGKLLIEGINMRKKHVKPKKSGAKGETVSRPGPTDVSNVKIICPKCGQATRVGYKIAVGSEPRSAGEAGQGRKGKKKYRVCKKCGQEI